VNGSHLIEGDVENDKCYMCGAPATTKDHIPPWGMFPEPKPDNPIKVRACRACNNGSSLDDEYFRLVVGACSNDSPQSMAVLNQRILRKARERPRLATMFLKSCVHVEEFSPGGIYIGPARAVKYDRSRIQVVINKIVRGLFLRHTGRSLGSKCVVEDFMCQPELNQNLMEKICCLPLFKVGDGKVFSYRYELPDPAGGESSWFLMFYNDTVLFIATTALLADALVGKAYEVEPSQAIP
jgi:hypothetical protein